MTNKNVKFSDFPLDKEILKALDLLGYKKPAKVQEELIPLILRGKTV
jgi:ATP-dependent RNA helicase DeaD